jgi:hypothetical protein
MSDLPPPTPPAGPGGFGPPGSTPPAPPGWPPGPGGSSPIPYQVPPPDGPWWKKRFAGIPTPVWLIVVLVGAATALFFLVRDDDKKAAPPITAPDITIPDVTIPKITAPDVSIPDVTVPDVTLPDVTRPDVTLPDVTLPDVTLPDVTLPDVTVPDITVPIPGSGDAAKDLTMAETWFYDSDVEGSYEWGALVVNSGKVAYEFVQVEADFFDDGGRLVGTEPGFISEVQPGKSVVTGLFGNPPAPATRIETKLKIDDFLTRPSDGPVGALTADQLAVANVTDFSFDVTGQLSSTFPADAENVQVVGLWRDASGKVTATATAYVDHVPPTTPTLFSMSVFSDSLERIPPTEIYFAYS